jgi:hypothetical protein
VPVALLALACGSATTPTTPSSSIGSTGSTGDTGGGAVPCGGAPVGAQILDGDAAPFDPGEPVTLTHGLATTWFVWVGIDATGTGSEVSVDPAIRVPDSMFVLSGGPPPVLVALVDYDEAACHGRFAPIQVQLDTERDSLDALCSGGMVEACGDAQSYVCALAGQPLELCATVTDLGGAGAASSCAPVTAALDPVDAPSCP